MKERPSGEGIARALGAFVREEEARTTADPRLGALVRGSASPDEVAALEEQAAHDPIAGEALALFRPIGDEAQGRYAAAIAAEVARGNMAPVSGESAQGVAANDQHPSAQPDPKRRAKRWLAPVSAGLAAAAAIALFLAQRPDGARTLPGYELTFTGGEVAARAEPSAPSSPVLGKGSRFTVVMRPATAVGGPVAGRLFLVQGEGAEVVEAEIKISPNGAVRFAAQLGDDFSARAGDAEIVAVVGRPEALPSPPVNAAALAGDGLRVVRRQVRIAESR